MLIVNTVVIVLRVLRHVCAFPRCTKRQSRVQRTAVFPRAGYYVNIQGTNRIPVHSSACAEGDF